MQMHGNTTVNAHKCAFTVVFLCTSVRIGKNAYCKKLNKCCVSRHACVLCMLAFSNATSTVMCKENFISDQKCLDQNVYNCLLFFQICA